MKIEKAIEILTNETHELILGVNDDYINAMKLGIEAMKRIQTGRTTGALGVSRLLPGETEE